VSDAERMARLFASGSPVHYVADFLNATRDASDKLVPVYRRVDGPATLEDFERHLAGKIGLLVVPTDAAGVSHWGAIDHDDYPVDHPALARRVAALKLPLSVNRSKSGGAHLYFFPKAPMPTRVLRERLVGFAATLGFPAKTEIFPKQDRSTIDAPGNGINLPYFGGDK
jgi:hypothetical protein